MSELYREGAYGPAIETAEEILARQPEDTGAMYALAYLYAVDGQIDDSLHWLDNAVAHGLADYLVFELDPDLNAIRSDPRYQAILQQARSKALQQNRAKSLDLTEGRWTQLVLRGDSELPRVEVALGFDRDGLLVRATVHDAHFKDGDRAWRYGDGFMINFGVPADTNEVYTDRFHAFGFCLRQGEPSATLVNEDGAYFLSPLPGMTPEIQVDRATMTADYRINIPWTRVAPFHPLLENHAGFNILYTSQNDDGSRTRLVYLDTVYFDSESTPLRRLAPLWFSYAADSPLALAGRLTPRLVTADTVEATLAVWSPEPQQLRLSMSVRDEDNRSVWTDFAEETASTGRSVRRRTVSLPPGGGEYQFVALLQGSLQWEESFYRIDPTQLERMRARVKTHVRNATPIVTNSREALRYRIARLADRIREFGPRSDLAAVRADFEDVASLTELFAKKGTIYERSGMLLSAFRSPLDSTLQPFSIVLPEGFDPAATYHLVVGLHGSGVDETAFTRWGARTFGDSDTVFLAPRGRNLSGWWCGDDGDEAAALVRQVQQMLHVDRTLCYGFSMGGYGVWRLGFRHPDLFDGVICVSGSPVPRGGSCGPDDDMRAHLGHGRELRYLVVHGTDDRAVPIGDTDAFVRMLEQAGYAVTYERIPGGGHGDFPVADLVKSWIASQFGGSR